MVAGVTVYLDAPVLAGGVELVDRPGTGSVFQRDTQAAHEALLTMDAAVFVLTADPPVSASERDLLGRVAELSVTTFAVLNKADYLDEAGLAEASEFTRRVLAEGGHPGTVYPMSARAALRGGDAGFTAFETDFTAYLSSRREADLHASAIAQAHRIRSALGAAAGLSEASADQAAAKERELAEREARCVMPSACWARLFQLEERFRNASILPGTVSGRLSCRVSGVSPITLAWPILLPAAPSPESPGRQAARHRLSLDGVLCLWDDRTGSYAELAAKPSIPLRVCIHGPSDGPWSGLADLRVLLVADVLTRIAELNGLQVIAVLAAASLPPGAFDQNASALGIHPPAACVSPEEAEALLGGSAHVHVARNTAGLGDRGNGMRIGVCPVKDLKPEDGNRAAEWQASGGNGCDLLALRLALLSRSHRQSVELTPATLAEAAESLGRWRRRVAE